MRKKSILILAAVLLVAVSSMVLAESIDVIVNVGKKVEVTEPGNIILEILSDDPTYTGNTSFDVKANYGVNVSMKSEGYGYDFFNNNITYSYSIDGIGGSFQPGIQGDTLNVSSGVNTVKFTATFDENALDGDEWVNISADNDYTDVVVVTVSAD